MAERRYDDEEVGRLLRAAAELQSGRELSGEGTTLDEIQRIAAEVGIDPEHVRRAAHELAPSPSSGSLSMERTVPGGLSDETWSELTAEMRRFSGTPGREDGRQWTDWGEMGGATLTASTRRGQTKISLIGSTGGIRALAVTLTIGYVILAVPMVSALLHRQLGPLWTTLLAFVVSLIGVVVAISAVRSHRRTFQARLEALFDRLEGIATTDQSPILVAPAPVVDEVTA